MKNILETLAQSVHFKTFVAALEVIELAEILRDEEEFTVFAPTDTAFACLPGNVLDELLRNKAALKALVQYHIAPVRLLTSDLESVFDLETLDGAELKIDSSEDGIQVNRAWIVQSNIECRNGVIHTINGVLLLGAAVR